MVETGGLENRFRGNPNGGSNPSPSAIKSFIPHKYQTKLELVAHVAIRDLYVYIIGAIAERERNLIVERVRAGMRRGRLERRHIGRTPFKVDRKAMVEDRQRGMILAAVARRHGISKASVCRVLKQAPQRTA